MAFVPDLVDRSQPADLVAPHPSLVVAPCLTNAEADIGAIDRWRGPPPTPICSFSIARALGGFQALAQPSLTTSLRHIEATQRAWSSGHPLDPDRSTYAATVGDNLFLGRLRPAT